MVSEIEATFRDRAHLDACDRAAVPDRKYGYVVMQGHLQNTAAMTLPQHSNRFAKAVSKTNSACCSKLFCNSFFAIAM